MTVAGALLRAADVREETRGAHARRDFPDARPSGAAASSTAVAARRRHGARRRRRRDRRRRRGRRRARPTRPLGGGARGGGPGPGRGPRPARGPHRHRSCPPTPSRPGPGGGARRRGGRRPAVRARDLRPGRPDGGGRLAAARRRRGWRRGRWSPRCRARCARSSPPSAPRSNFLCHLSGVATLTRRYVDAVTRRQPGHPGARHAQDDARPARPREGGRARRRGAGTTAPACPTPCS